jgi:TolA-binding protein
MDNKIFKGDNAKEYQDISSIDPNELICCGYVDFEKEINSKAYLLNQIEKQNKKIEMQTQELQKQNKTIEELLIAVRNLQNQNGGNKTGEKKEKNYIEKNSEDST